MHCFKNFFNTVRVIFLIFSIVATLSVRRQAGLLLLENLANHRTSISINVKRSLKISTNIKNRKKQRTQKFENILPAYRSQSVSHTSPKIIPQIPNTL